MLKWTVEELAEMVVKAVATFPKLSLKLYSSQRIPYEVRAEEMEEIRKAYFALAKEYNLRYHIFKDEHAHGWHGPLVAFYNGPLGQIVNENWPSPRSDGRMGIYADDDVITIIPHIPYGCNLASKDDKSRKLAEQLGEHLVKISSLKVIIPKRECEEDILSGFKWLREFDI